MRLDKLHNFSGIKQGDTKRVFRLQALDDDESPISLTGYNSVKVVIGNDKGKLLELTPTLEAQTGVFSFSFDADDLIGNGEMKLELHLSDSNGKVNILPERGYYEFKVEKSLDTLQGSNVSSYTLNYFMTEFEKKNTVLQDVADEAITTANQAKETSDSVRTELDAVVGRETDSDAMSRQAAVNASGVDKVNLKQRLDDDYNKVNELLAETVKERGVNIYKHEDTIPNKNVAATPAEWNWTTAIQLILDAGKVVLLPEGTFSHHSLNLLPESAIVGVGVHKTKLKYLSSTGKAINAVDSPKFLLANFTLIGQGGSATDTGNDGIFVSSAKTSEAEYTNRSWVIQGIRIESFGGTAFNVEKCISPGGAWGRTGQLMNLQAYNCYRGFKFGIRGEYTESLNLMAWACIWGIEIAAGNTKITNSQFDDNANGAKLTGGTNNGHGQFIGCSFNHNDGYCVLLDGVSYGHVFNGCAFYTGELTVKSSAGVIFVGGLLGPNKITLDSNTGATLFDAMHVREDSVSTINKIGTNIYKFTNCIERNTGLSKLNNYDCTALILRRSANATYTASPIKVAMTVRDLEVFRGYDYSYRYSSNQYTVGEKGIYEIAFSLDYLISSGSGVQLAQINKNGAVIASSQLAPKTGGASGVVKTTVLLDVGDIVYPQLSDTDIATGTRQVVASPETYFTMTLVQRVPAV
ncbi:hypothetical protein [Rossellomorea vietnamensis]|uniref:hypothetical protein n=1 Tax=Rossellomorea vietnamensis TaxID=218284 RepID=UPI0005572A07|nr:hypothetical protein [Rossellomorea vietnamensis]